LPPFVKEKVKIGGRNFAYEQSHVAILFCNISNFEEICIDLSPKNLIQFLDNFFNKLDKFCLDLGVTKIETVEKTYMACTGLEYSEMED